jgi:hypothetical protein
MSESERLSYMSEAIAEMDDITYKAGAKRIRREIRVKEVALNLIKLGIEDDIIIASTGLDSDAIKELHAEVTGEAGANAKVALNVIKNSCSDDKITAMTGLDSDAIRNLRAEEDRKDAGLSDES